MHDRAQTHGSWTSFACTHASLALMLRLHSCEMCNLCAAGCAGWRAGPGRYIRAPGCKAGAPAAAGPRPTPAAVHRSQPGALLAGRVAQAALRGQVCAASQCRRLRGEGLGFRISGKGRGEEYGLGAAAACAYRQGTAAAIMRLPKACRLAALPDTWQLAHACAAGSRPLRQRGGARSCMGGSQAADHYLGCPASPVSSLSAAACSASSGGSETARHANGCLAPLQLHMAYTLVVLPALAAICKSGPAQPATALSGCGAQHAPRLTPS